jgi:hypothetical protein
VVGKRAFMLLLLTALATGCDKADQPGNEVLTLERPRASADQPGVTPMADRIAVLGLLNKRNGIVRDFTMKPGQAIRVKDITIRLKACETTAPWELEKLTGAFVQVDRLRTDGQWVRRFSGWLYRESPSLNVLEDPVYDVWVKRCAMSWPSGPAAPAAPADTRRSSSAPNSGGGSASEASPVDSVAEPATEEPAPPPPPAEDSAEDNNPT